MKYLNGRSADSIYRTTQRLQGSRRRELKDNMRSALLDAYNRAARAYEDTERISSALAALQGPDDNIEQVLETHYASTGLQAANRIRKAAQRRRRSVSYAGKGELGHKETEERMQDLVQAWIAKFGAQKITRINDTTRNQAQKILRDAAREGLGMRETAKRLSTLGEDFSKYRSWMISRTETLGAWMGGEMAAARELVPNMGKQWLTADDERVRGDPGGEYPDAYFRHSEAHLQEKGMHDSFDVGGEYLDHPGDPMGSAGNVIHCRCVLGYKED